MCNSSKPNQVAHPSRAYFWCNMHWRPKNYTETKTLLIIAKPNGSPWSGQICVGGLPDSVPMQMMVEQIQHVVGKGPSLAMPVLSYFSLEP